MSLTPDRRSFIKLGTGAAFVSALGFDLRLAHAQADLARGYYATGRLGDAITLLSDGVSRAERSLPPGDPLTQRIREALTNLTG